MIHPTIKDFWETIALVWSMPIRYEGRKSVAFFFIEKQNPRRRIPVAREFLNGQIRYYTEGSNILYTEEQMLRIIKMKAFL